MGYGYGQPSVFTNLSVLRVLVFSTTLLGLWGSSVAWKPPWADGQLVHWWQVRTNWFPGAFTRNPRVNAATVSRVYSKRDPGFLNWTLPPAGGGAQVSPGIFPQLYHTCRPLDHCKQTDEHTCSPRNSFAFTHRPHLNQAVYGVWYVAGPWKAVQLLKLK